MVIDFNENLQLILQYLKRNDNKGIFEHLPGGTIYGEMETEGGFAEIVWLPKGMEGRWALSLLYNKVDSDDKRSIYENISFTTNYLVTRNVRFLTEIENDLGWNKLKFSMGISSAF